MSFNLTRLPTPKLIDIRSNYQEITEEFCKYYYSIYDTNFIALSTLYYLESQFTFQNEEFIGFYNLVNKIKSHGLEKFTHSNLNVNVQPIGQKNLEIIIYGHISLNDSIFSNKFIENVILQRDDNNRIFVISTIFKIIE